MDRDDVKPYCQISQASPIRISEIRTAWRNGGNKFNGILDAKNEFALITPLGVDHSAILCQPQFENILINHLWGFRIESHKKRESLVVFNSILNARKEDNESFGIDDPELEEKLHSLVMSFIDFENEDDSQWR